MIYAVFDTNVLVSALLSRSSESTINKLIHAMMGGDYHGIYFMEIEA